MLIDETMMLSYIFDLFLLLTLSASIYSFLKDTSLSKYLLLTVIFGGLITSVLVQGGIPFYPQWHFYPEPIEQNITYSQLLVGDSERNTIFYDHRASFIGGSGREHRPAPLLLALNDEKQNLVACKLVEDAIRYRKQIENENHKLLATPQGYGKTWNKSVLTNYGEFTYLQVREENIYITADGKQVKNRTSSIRAEFQCS
jgi:hypothetical protein